MAMAFILLPMAAAIFLTLALVGAISTRRRAHRKLSTVCNIKGPKCPSLLAGHFAQLRSAAPNAKCPVEVMSQWEHDHGDVYGVYFGPTPTVVVGDPVEIQRVVAKSSKVFPDRPPLAVPVEPIVHSLVGLRGDDWRRVRRTLNPKFAPEKCMAVLEPVIHEKLDTCIANLQKVAKSSSKTVDIVGVAESLCFDVVCSAVLGIQPDDSLFDAVRTFLAKKLDGAIKAAIYCPGLMTSKNKLNPVAKFLTSCAQKFGFHPKASRMLLERVTKVVNDRLEPKTAANTTGCPFFSKPAINANSQADEKNNNVASAENESDSQSHQDILQFMLDDEGGKLSKEEIIANAWVFLLGGFDTVAQALAFTLYLLAENPEAQEKVHQEIVANVQDPQKPDIQEVTKLPYLDQVLKESLRMYPPVNLNVSRHCLEDFPLKNSPGYIPKGANIHLPLYQLHRNEKYWEEPEKFCPERFEPAQEKKRQRMSYIPFGAGPRYCIGKHFAIMEAKVSLVRILSNFMFEATQPGKKLDLVLPLVTLKAAGAISLKCHQRKSSQRSSCPTA